MSTAPGVARGRACPSRRPRRPLSTSCRYAHRRGQTSRQKDASTVFTTFCDRTEGIQFAGYVAGQLTVASESAIALRGPLMHSRTSLGLFPWPQHDPVATERLSQLNGMLESCPRSRSQRSRQRTSRAPIKN